MERTLILVKPDGVQRNLSGAIIDRFERRGLKIVGLKLINVPKSVAEEHYAEHQGKGFYPGLISFITSGPVIAMVLEGPNAIKLARGTIGGPTIDDSNGILKSRTNPVEAAPGTIRGDWGLSFGMNLVHGSAVPADAEREIGIWFKPEELVSYAKDIDKWVLE